MSPTRLVRSSSDQMIAGVCGGLAEYLGVDPVFVRGAFVLLFFASGVGIPLYLILLFVMPSDEEAALSDVDKVREPFDFDSADSTETERNGRNTAAVLLILLGVFLLIEQLGWISSAFFWPLGLIGLGIYLAVRRSQN